MSALDEFRQDPVSGDWVLVATKRGKRPHDLKKYEHFMQPIETCPFEDFGKSGNEVVWAYPNPNPIVTVIRNKYPAVEAGACVPSHEYGPYQVNFAVGWHDIIVFRDHDRHLADFTKDEMILVTRAYKKRYTELMNTAECTAYVFLFHNYGKEAGASLSHPHSQIISLPILPPDVWRSLHGSQRFYKEHHRRVYDLTVTWEKEQARRVIYENDFFIAFCPFVSKNPYEIRIFAKDGHAHFDKMPETLDPYFADIFLAVLNKVRKALNDPPFNFFIHTAPTEAVPGTMHEFYTWHVEILPKVKIDAGFELGTGIEINSVDPDDAAQLYNESGI